eukprot:s1777_g17.t1
MHFQKCDAPQSQQEQQRGTLRCQRCQRHRNSYDLDGRYRLSAPKGVGQFGRSKFFHGHQVADLATPKDLSFFICCGIMRFNSRHGQKNKSFHEFSGFPL